MTAISTWTFLLASLLCKMSAPNVLMVAEKPSVALAIAKIVSEGRVCHKNTHLTQFLEKQHRHITSHTDDKRQERMQHLQHPRVHCTLSRQTGALQGDVCCRPRVQVCTSSLFHHLQKTRTNTREYLALHSTDFAPQYQNWANTDPLDLFTCPIRKVESDSKVCTSALCTSQP